MKTKFVVGWFGVVFLSVLVPAFAQFTTEELAERPKWEEFLLTANIVKEEQMVGPESVTSPWHLTLEKDGLTHDALWKSIEGRVKGYIESWRYEVAAYLFDKYLELNMVPPTVERRVHNDRGSCQIWVTAWKSLKRVQEEKIKKPSYKIFGWNRAINLQRAFDNLIANEDRHLNNYLIMEDWRVILIDHSRSFRTGKKFTTQLIYGEKHREKLMMKELPRAMFEKVKALSYEAIKSLVSDYLTDDEINGVLARKELIIKEIEKLIQQNGEENVLY